MKVPMYFDCCNDANKNLKIMNGVPLNKVEQIYQPHDRASNFLPISDSENLNDESFIESVDSSCKKFYYPIYVNYNLYPVEVMNNMLDSFKIPDEVIAAVKKQNCIILIVNSYEGWDLDDLDKLIRKTILQKYNLTFSNVVYCTGNLNTISKNNVKNIHHNHWEGIFDFYKNIEPFTNSFDFFHKKVFSDTHRNYKFICLQRRLKPQRLALMLELYNEKSKILTMGTDSNEKDFKSVTKRLKNTYSSSYKKFKQFHTKLPIEYDVNLMNENPTHDSNFKKYIDSYLNIVSETYFENNRNQLFFSEKIIKPVVFFQPFILFSQTGSLEKFKQLGFNTFEPYIDESYDLIDNDTDRFYSAVQSVFKFVNRDISEIHLDMQKLFPIFVHNYYNLKTRRSFYKEKLVFELLTELNF
jgi:hypothetical protein